MEGLGNLIKFFIFYIVYNIMFSRIIFNKYLNSNNVKTNVNTKKKTNNL